MYPLICTNEHEFYEGERVRGLGEGGVEQALDELAGKGGEGLGRA